MISKPSLGNIALTFACGISYWIVGMNLFEINNVNFTLDGFTIKDMDHGMAINAYDGRYSTFRNLILKNNVEYRFQKSTICAIHYKLSL